MTMNTLSLLPLFQTAEVRGLVFGGAFDPEGVAEVRRFADALSMEGVKGLFLDDLPLNSGQRAAFWRSEGLYAALGALGIKKDEILVVTDLPSEREELLLLGIRGCLLTNLPGKSREENLSQSLQIYFSGEILPGDSVPRLADPVHYTYLVGRRQATLSEQQFASSLERGSPPMKSYQAIANELLGTTMTSALEPHLKALFIDHQLWGSFHGNPSLAEKAAGFLDPALLPRFRTVDQVRDDAIKLVDGLLAVVTTGKPEAARPAVERLLAELESFSRLKESFLRETGIVRALGDRIRSHIRDHHDDYVTRTGVFHEDEWRTMVRVFEEDDLELDRRFTEWINETYRVERQMAARNQPAGKIRLYVKERLVDDLLLRVLELEMRDRSLRLGVSRVLLFPTHHESKNRAIVLTQGIDNRKFWEKMMVTETATLSRWVYSLMARLSLSAKSARIALRFRHHSSLERPPRDLNDLTDDQRESLDHIVTELLSNAIKYRRRAPDAKNKIKVTVTETDRGVEIKFRDKGVGIRDTSAIWRPDVREHPELADGYGGGLPSVMKHVQKNGWIIEVDSEPDQYTLFRLFIPMKNSTMPPPADAPE